MQHPRLEWCDTWLATRRGSLVAGEWDTASDTPLVSLNPTTGRALGAPLAAASPATVEAAVGAAVAAFHEGLWPKLPRRVRSSRLRAIAALIRDHQAELATLESRDNGKLYREAWDDVTEAADVFDYYAGWTDKLTSESIPVDDGFVNYTLRTPAGVCALVVPWNFPLLLLAWKLAPALAMGNACVVKPSDVTPYTALRLAELIRDADLLPQGVLSVVVGGPEVGEALTRHPRVDRVSFTGSTAVGRKVATAAAQSNLKQVSLELGGKSPCLVFADCPEPEAALDRVFTAMFSHKGEKCSEPTRLLVEKPLYDRFVAGLAARAEKVVCGDPFASVSDQGPQCTELQMEKVLAATQQAVADGARLVAGGRRDRPGAGLDGWFVRPTVLADVDGRMRVAQEEVFGPLLVVIPFASEEEAVRVANDTPYGLAAGLYTADVSRAHRVAGRLEAGMVFVNRYGCYDFASPFGGWKQSGWGHEMAHHSLLSVSKLKSVWIKV